MRIALLAFCSLSILLPLRMEAANTPPRIADYTINVTLDAKAKTLHGRERIVWRNTSTDSVGELQFHLYLNAFRTGSTFRKETRGGRELAKEKSTGWTDVKSIKVSGVELKERIRYLHPDSPDPEDRTVMSIALPSPVPPGGSVAVDLVFDAKLPPASTRTGYSGTAIFAGQWFPKLGVYESAGMRGRQRGGWNTHQFHENSEFYADFGRYDVSIDVPAKYVVGATGRLVSRRATKDRVVHRYVQEGVHDFFWTADPKYVVSSYTFAPKRDVPSGWQERIASTLGRSAESIALRPIEVRLLMQPEHGALTPKIRNAANIAIAWYGLHFGPYPYSNVTIVDTPEAALGAAGVEYPTIFTVSGSSRLARWPLDGIRWPEVVTLHEYGHQYWYGIVASNEFEEPWLDEGINSFCEMRAMDAAYGRTYSMFGLGVSTYASFRRRSDSAPPVDPINSRSWEFMNSGSYFSNSYPGSALVLRQLESDLGSRAFFRGMRLYYDRWAFRHPSTDDFFAAMEKASGRDLDLFRRELIDRPGDFDIFVQEVKSRPAGKKSFISSITIGRSGTVPHGAVVRVRFADGTVGTKRFTSDYRWTTWRVERPSRVVEVVVDPELRNSMDSNLLNNRWSSEEVSSARWKILLRTNSLYLRFIHGFWSFA